MAGELIGLGYNKPHSYRTDDIRLSAVPAAPVITQAAPRLFGALSAVTGATTVWLQERWEDMTSEEREETIEDLEKDKEEIRKQECDEMLDDEEQDCNIEFSDNPDEKRICKEVVFQRYGACLAGKIEKNWPPRYPGWYD